MFVQLVIAAITTEPSCSEPGVTSEPVSPPNAPAGPSPKRFGSRRGQSGTAADFGFTFGLQFWRTLRANAGFMFVNGTRSCGRVGPAKLGSTFARSSSRTSVYDASGVFASWNMPCSL